MPFIIARGDPTKTVEAELYKANMLGLPDRRSKVRILIRKISDQYLLIEPDDSRQIIATLHRDNGETVYTVAGGRKSLAAAARLARLQKAAGLLDQLRGVLTALAADNSAQHHLAAVEAWVNSQRGARIAGGTNVPPDLARSDLRESSSFSIALRYRRQSMNTKLAPVQSPCDRVPQGRAPPLAQGSS